MFAAAKDGQPLARIVHAPDASRVVRFAARELATYLGRICGCRFTVEATTEMPAEPVIIIRSRAGDDDGFTRERHGQQLCLIGHQPRGCLYAVYDLLEAVGCRFLAPGEERIPSTPNLEVPDHPCEQTPAFSLRNLFRTATHLKQDEPFHFLDAGLTIPQIDWLAKRRFNHFAFYVDYYRLDLWESHKLPILEALMDRGFTLEASFHSLHYFCPPDENHDFGQFGPSTYRLNHPDWYLPARELGRGMWQTRVELPAVREIVIERYLDYLERNPELDIVGLWPDDIPMNTPQPGLEPADGYLAFWNAVSREVAAAAPRRKVGTIAYFELIRPPRQQRPAANQHCWFCPLERNYQYPITHEQNRHWLTPLQAWTELQPPGQLGIFEYYGWATSFIPFREIARQDLQVYRDLGVPGIYGWSGFTTNILGEDDRWALDFYVLGHLLWDPGVDITGLEQQWVSLYPGAEAQIFACFEFLKEAHARQAAKGLGYYFGWQGNYSWIDLGTFMGVQHHLERARQGADDDTWNRIDRLEVAVAKALTAQVERTCHEPDPLYWQS